MNIIVVGSGYVGLVATCCLTNSGHRQICVEADHLKQNSKRGLQSQLGNRVKGYWPTCAKDISKGKIAKVILYGA